MILLYHGHIELILQELQIVIWKMDKIKIYNKCMSNTLIVHNFLERIINIDVNNDLNNDVNNDINNEKYKYIYLNTKDIQYSVFKKLFFYKEYFQINSSYLLENKEFNRYIFNKDQTVKTTGEKFSIYNVIIDSILDDLKINNKNKLSSKTLCNLQKFLSYYNSLLRFNTTFTNSINIDELNSILEDIDETNYNIQIHTIFRIPNRDIHNIVIVWQYNVTDII